MPFDCDNRKIVAPHALNDTKTVSMSHSLEDNELLDRLSRDKVVELVPVIVYVVIMMITGLFGNIMVFHFYGKRDQVTPTTRLIVAVAYIDTFICVLMPKDVVELCLSCTFTSSALCKLNVFVNYTSVIASALTLIAIAAFRFNAVCKPLSSQFTLRHANISILIVIVSAFLISIPVLGTHEPVTINIRVNSTLTIVGYDCNTSKEPTKKPLNLAVNVFHFFIFSAASLTLFVLYGKMGLQIMRYYRRKNLIFGGPHSPNVTSDNTGKSIVDSGNNNNTYDQDKRKATCDQCNADSDQIKTFDILDEGRESTHVTECNKNGSDIGEMRETAHFDDFKNVVLCSQNNIGNNNQKTKNRIECGETSYEIGNNILGHYNGIQQASAHLYNGDTETKDRLQLKKARIDKTGTSTISVVTIRPTLMHFIINLIFFVSFLPYLVMIITRTLSNDKDGNENFTNFIQFCTRSYLINSAANPFVYGLFNTEFRNFVKITFCRYCKK